MDKIVVCNIKQYYHIHVVLAMDYNTLRSYTCEVTREIIWKG